MSLLHQLELPEANRISPRWASRNLRTSVRCLLNKHLTYNGPLLLTLAGLMMEPRIAYQPEQRIRITGDRQIGTPRRTFKARRLLLPSAHCRRKAGLRAEITLNRLQLSVLDSEILHVPERFAILGVAKILHKSLLP